MVYITTDTTGAYAELSVSADIQEKKRGEIQKEREIIKDQCARRWRDVGASESAKYRGTEKKKQETQGSR